MMTSPQIPCLHPCHLAQSLAHPALADIPSPCGRQSSHLPALPSSLLLLPPCSLLSLLQVTLPLEPPIFTAGEPRTFAVDSLLWQVTVRMHGDISSFRIKSPAGALMWGSRVKNGRGTAQTEENYFM